MIRVLIKLAPVAMKVTKALIVIAPHAVTVYQHIKARKPSQPRKTMK